MVPSNRIAEQLEEAVEGVDVVIGELSLRAGREAADVAKKQADFFSRHRPTAGFTFGHVGIHRVMHKASDFCRAGRSTLADNERGPNDSRASITHIRQVEQRASSAQR